MDTSKKRKAKGRGEVDALKESLFWEAAFSSWLLLGTFHQLSTNIKYQYNTKKTPIMRKKEKENHDKIGPYENCRRLESATYVMK